MCGFGLVSAGQEAVQGDLEFVVAGPQSADLCYDGMDKENAYGAIAVEAHAHKRVHVGLARLARGFGLAALAKLLSLAALFAEHWRWRCWRWGCASRPEKAARERDSVQARYVREVAGACYGAGRARDLPFSKRKFRTHKRAGTLAE